MEFTAVPGVSLQKLGRVSVYHLWSWRAYLLPPLPLLLSRLIILLSSATSRAADIHKKFCIRIIKLKEGNIWAPYCVIFIKYLGITVRHNILLLLLVKDSTTCFCLKDHHQVFVYIWNLILLFGHTLPPHWPVFTCLGVIIWLFML
jgi:hypothetical protein